MGNRAGHTRTIHPPTEPACVTLPRPCYVHQLAGREATIRHLHSLSRKALGAQAARLLPLRLGAAIQGRKALVWVTATRV
jgi:hypothetical protein